MRLVFLTIFISLFLIFSLSAVKADTTFFDQSDSFVMGNSPTTYSGITGGTTGTGGCLYKWNCTNWSECLSSGKQTRNCTNIGTCPNTYKSPEINQNCTYTPSPKMDGENKTGKISGEEIVDKSKILIYFIIILAILLVIFYLKKLYKNSKSTNKEKRQEKINSALDDISSLINRKVYTENGIYIGDVVDVALGTNRVYSIKVDIKNEKYELGKIKGCIINIKNIKIFGKIIIADKEVVDRLMDKTTN